MNKRASLDEYFDEEATIKQFIDNAIIFRNLPSWTKPERIQAIVGGACYDLNHRMRTPLRRIAEESLSFVIASRITFAQRCSYGIANEIASYKDQDLEINATTLSMLARGLLESLSEIYCILNSGCFGAIYSSLKQEIEDLEYKIKLRAQIINEGGQWPNEDKRIQIAKSDEKRLRETLNNKKIEIEWIGSRASRAAKFDKIGKGAYQALSQAAHPTLISMFHAAEVEVVPEGFAVSTRGSFLENILVIHLAGLWLGQAIFVLEQFPTICDKEIH